MFEAGDKNCFSFYVRENTFRRIPNASKLCRVCNVDMKFHVINEKSAMFEFF